eukprot:SAG11_NODE_1016_length_6169_cov_19.544975_9_plen_59_part_00
MARRGTGKFQNLVRALAKLTSIFDINIFKPRLDLYLQLCTYAAVFFKKNQQLVGRWPG